MSLRTKLGEIQRRALCTVYRRSTLLASRKPLVSFCFDDFPRTALTVGGSVLQTFGLRGTYYVAMGLKDKATELGEHFNLEDLHSLVEKGHELASHTYCHISSRKVSSSTFCRDARRGRDAICEIGLVPSANFAYPFGDVTIASKKLVGRDMASCRGTQVGVNGPRIDLNLLRANRLYGDLEQLQTVEHLLTLNKARNAWLIFYTHDVRPNPSKYGCTARLLEMAVAKALAAGSEVLPVMDVVTGLNADREHSRIQQNAAI